MKDEIVLVHPSSFILHPFPINTPARCPAGTPERTGPDRPAAVAHRRAPGCCSRGSGCWWWSGSRWRRTGSSSRGPSKSEAWSWGQPRIVGSLRRPGRRARKRTWVHSNSRGSLSSTRLAGSVVGVGRTIRIPCFFALLIQGRTTRVSGATRRHGKSLTFSRRRWGSSVCTDRRVLGRFSGSARGDDHAGWRAVRGLFTLRQRRESSTNDQRSRIATDSAWRRAS
jgi:hypothetical protein